MFKVLFSFILISAILIIIFLNCGESKIENLQKRLDDFKRILPLNLKENFDSKNYEKVSQGIDSLLFVDSLFRRNYLSLKDKEAINSFSTKEVVLFYKEYFVKEIERLKRERSKD